MASRSKAGTGFPDAQHDHQHCIDEALERAEAVCARAGVRLTPLRKRVLELVWDSHTPLGAYAILEMLRRDGGRPAPPTVYRSLEFLLEHGLVHRISSLNAFVGCERPGHRGEGQFLICQECGSAAELNDASVSSAIAQSASELGFDAQKSTVEVVGLCPDCRSL